MARNAQGVVIENQAVGVRISLHEGTATGTVVYQETHAATTNEFGLFNLAIGGGTVVSGTFGTIDWGNNDYYVQVEMDAAGGTAYADMGTSQLLSVPYAMYAANAGVPGVEGPAGPAGPAGPTGPLVAGTSGQTLRHDGSDWVASSTLFNSGTNVGVGTTTPVSTLHVASSGSEIAHFESPGASKWISLNQGNTRKGILWSSFDDIVLRADATLGNLRFQTSGNNNRMVIDADGLIGVGTVAPVRNLHLLQDQFTGVGGPGGLELEQSFTNNEWTLYVSQSTDDLKLYYNGADRGAFNDVTGVYTSVSDKRLKKNIERLDGMLDKIMLLNPTKYHFKKQADAESKSFGLIAQEVESVFPEIVTINGDDTNGNGISDLRMVSYSELIPVLISGIQEQQEMIEQLKAEVELLKNK